MDSEKDRSPIIHRVLDIVNKWPTEGQWVFIVLMVILSIGTFFGALYALCILNHGWPR